MFSRLRVKYWGGKIEVEGVFSAETSIIPLYFFHTYEFHNITTHPANVLSTTRFQYYAYVIACKSSILTIVSICFDMICCFCPSDRVRLKQLPLCSLPAETSWERAEKSLYNCDIILPREFGGPSLEKNEPINFRDEKSLFSQPAHFRHCVTSRLPGC